MWYLSARVPKGVAHHYSTASIERSLKTRDYDEAVTRAHRLLSDLSAEWKELSAWDDDLLRQARRIVAQGQLHKGDEANLSLRDLQAIADACNPEIPKSNDAMDDVTSARWEHAALQEHHRNRLRVFLATKEDGYGHWYQRQKEAQERLGADAAVPLPESVLVDTIGNRPSAVFSGRSLMNVLEAWRHDTDASQATFDEYYPRIRRFEELFGMIDVSTITKDQIANYVEQVEKIPAHLGNEDSLLPLPACQSALNVAPLSGVGPLGRTTGLK